MTELPREFTAKSKAVLILTNGRLRTQRSEQAASLLIGLFFVMMALIGLAYAAAISKPPSPVTPTPSPSAAITPSPVPSIPSPSATITPSPVTSGAFPSATAPPSPVSSPTPLSEKAIRALWTPVIYHSLNSKLVESYIPDEVHAADLIDAIRDNEGLAELIEKFESKVNDDVLEKWFIDINFTLKNIQKDLQLVDHRVLDFPDVLGLGVRERRPLQTAEYGRVRLLGLLTQVSLQLGMEDPQFPNSTAKAVPAPVSLPNPTVTPSSSEIRR